MPANVQIVTVPGPIKAEVIIIPGPKFFILLITFIWSDYRQLQSLDTMIFYHQGWV